MKQSTFLKKALRAIVADGWEIVSVDADGEAIVSGAMSVKSAVAAAGEVDECHINVQRKTLTGVERNWLYIVWQGPDATYADGEEIISDHGVGLSGYIDPLYSEV